jgi:hypothetical protein
MMAAAHVERHSHDSFHQPASTRGACAPNPAPVTLAQLPSPHGQSTYIDAIASIVTYQATGPLAKHDCSDHRRAQSLDGKMQVAKGPLVVRVKSGFKNVPSIQHMRRRTAVVMTSKTVAAPSLLPLLSPAAVHHPFSSAPSSAIAAAFGACRSLFTQDTYDLLHLYL